MHVDGKSIGSAVDRKESKDMSSQQVCTGCARSDKDLQHSSQFSERLLNDAIVRADISRSFEEYYLDIVDGSIPIRSS